MIKNKLILLNLFVISSSLVCFEILSTRIASVVFVNNYAFMILSIAILGLGSGGIYSYYKKKSDKFKNIYKTLFNYLLLVALSYFIFIIVLVKFSVTNPIIFFILISFPYFFSGVVYAHIFRRFSAISFKIYAFDLLGAAFGALLAIVVFSFMSAPNAILFISIIILFSAISIGRKNIDKKKNIISHVALLITIIFLVFNGKENLIGEVPIGNFAEKDYYHVYSGQNIVPNIVESRWSIYGRSDLVEYNHQDIVKQLFIDGSAGTQMYRFDGNLQNVNPMLYNILIRNSTTIPLLSLREYEKNNMLIIGPGGGKEVLTGLLTGVKSITGIEINSDFVDLVKQYKNFNGGLFTDFENVEILVKEGRHFIKKTDNKFDILLMALPSTEQLQSIDNFAMNENYLLTVEALKDYLNILTPEGRLILTVHNRWELVRIIVTTLYALNDLGISNKEALNHFMILGAEYSPTIIIKKNNFTEEEIIHIENISDEFPDDLPKTTYIPNNWSRTKSSIENKLLNTIYRNEISLEQYIDQDKYDISPIYDDSPYFYKVIRGVPSEYLKLAVGVFTLSLLILIVSYLGIRKKINQKNFTSLIYSLFLFVSIGLGFMILEISLFQKLVLYLGSPTISLTVLLSSLLIGMGIGSFLGDRFYKTNLIKKISIVSLLIFCVGLFSFLVIPLILNGLLIFNQLIRSVVSFILIVPLGFLLGIPFPSGIQLLKKYGLEKYIPLMYGVNGIMSVLGSILSVILSMTFGFTIAFITGLSLYLIISIISKVLYNKI